MPFRQLDAFSTLADWQALESDGTTPSTAIAVDEELALDTPGGDRHSIRLAFSPLSLDHLARCTLPGENLDDYDELRLVLRGDRASAPGFYLELRLGSAALPIDAPGNDWHRRIPLGGGGTWDVVRLSLADLPPAVRGAVTTAELRCIDASAAFHIHIDQILAVRPALLVDLEQALFERLDGFADIDATPVPAERVAAGGSWPATTPCIAIVPLDVQVLADRGTGTPQRCDFLAEGYRMRPAPIAYEARYAIEPVAADRDDQAALMDAVLARVGPRGELRVAGLPWSIESLPAPTLERDPDAFPAPRQRLYCRVVGWQDVAPSSSVQPVEGFVTRIEWKENGRA